MKTTSNESPTLRLPVPSRMFCVVSPAQAALAPGAVPVPAKFTIARPSTETNAFPNSAAMSSNIVRLSTVTVPVFSKTSVNATSQLSPLATASPAVLAMPTSGISSGVGSSLVPLLPGSLGLSPFGSLPLSESSSAVIGLPFGSVSGAPFSSTASPPPVTVLLIGLGAPAALTSTSTVNSSTSESPTANIEAVAASTISVVPLPSHVPSTATELPASVGAVVSVRP